MQIKVWLILLAALILGGTFPVNAQEPTHHQAVRAALQTKELVTAQRLLERMRERDPKEFAANNYDYLLGRLTKETGDRAESQASFESVIARDSVLASHAHWHLAALARSGGDLVAERERLRRFIIITPFPELRDQATLRLGQSFWESGDHSGAISALKPLLSAGNQALKRQAWLITARSLAQSGKPTEARAQFLRLLMEMPDAARPDDFALEAVRALDASDSEAATKAMSDADRLLRASVYMFNRDFESARRHYLAVAQSNPQGPAAANALYQVARTFYQQLKYDEALKYFQRVSADFPGSTSARDALGFAAATLNRLKRTDEAVATYKQLIDRYPDAPNPERAYINLIDALHEAGRHGEALSWVQQARTRFPSGLPNALALFAQTRIHLAQGNWTAVVSDIDELRRAGDLGGTRVSSGTTRSEIDFLRAFALEQLGRTAEAIDAYLAIPDGRNEYYGQLATGRLRAMASSSRQDAVQTRAQQLRTLALAPGSDPRVVQESATAALRIAPATDRPQLLERLKHAYASLPNYRLPSLRETPLGRRDPVGASTSRPATPQAIADELFFLGLYDEGVPAYLAISPLSAAQTEKTDTPAPATQDREYTLALYALRGDLAHRAVRFGERLWRSVPADYVFELAPRELLELLYPLPYRESLVRHATPRGVDPLLVISIARQESRFQADAKSVAAARGMTQFIPETADEIARQLGRSNFQQDELYDPDTAILFGSQYLANLFQQFPNQPEAVAASYNGGPENVARWMARSKANVPERYVSEIGFAQTKDYVFKVITNLRAYQQLYPDLQR